VCQGVSEPASIMLLSQSSLVLRHLEVCEHSSIRGKTSTKMRTEKDSEKIHFGFSTPARHRTTHATQPVALYLSQGELPNKHPIQNGHMSFLLPAHSTGLTATDSFSLSRHDQRNLENLIHIHDARVSAYGWHPGSHPRQIL
jgi:hypothetical protein